MEFKWISAAALLSLLLALVALLQPELAAAKHFDTEAMSVYEQGTTVKCDAAPLLETTLPWPRDVHQAVSEALCRRPSDVLPGDDRRLILTSLTLFEDNWAIATVVMRPDVMPTRYESLLLFDSLVVLAHKDYLWQVAFEGTTPFDRLVHQAPLSVVGEPGRAYFRSQSSPDPSTGLPRWLNLKWPWRAGQKWYYTQGPHSTEKGGLDFGPWSIPEPEREVRASARGAVIRLCDDEIQSSIILVHSGNYATSYVHLDRRSTAHLAVGKNVEQGARLGLTYNADDFSSSCGHGTAPHVHLHVGSMVDGKFKAQAVVGTVISGWELHTDGCFRKDGETERCRGSRILSDNEYLTIPFYLPVLLHNSRGQ